MPAQKSQIQEHLKKAREALAANASDTAVIEYRAVLELDSANVEAQANLGVIAFFRSDCQGASRYFNAALANQPGLSKAEALLGICEKRLGIPSATTRLERSFSDLSDPKLRVQVGIELAGTYYQTGDLHRTSSLIQSLVEIDPENVDVLYFAQLLYGELADSTLAKLAVLAPASARMQQVIGERLVNAGDLKGAIEHYRKALKIEPRLAGIRYELSQAILALSSSNPTSDAEAQALLQEAIMVEGDNARIESVIGAIAVNQGDLDSAFSHYQRAIELNPRELQAQIGLGRLWAAKGKPEEAVKFLLKAVELDPLSGPAHYRLALAYRDLHLAADADRELKLYREIRETTEHVRELYRQMNKQPRDDGAAESPNKIKTDG